MMGLPVLIPSLNSVQIIQSSLMVERKLLRMCRSKKKRKIKKWLKNPKNYGMVPQQSYILDETKRAIFCHPVIAKRLIKAIAIENKNKSQI